MPKLFGSSPGTEEGREALYSPPGGASNTRPIPPLSTPLGGRREVQQPRRRDDRPSLLDRNRPFFSGIQRFGLDKVKTYASDPFHTLLNLPWWKFISVFFIVYLVQFCFFALLYWAQPDGCILGLTGSYAHALWMSSRTASTIGYNEIHPTPDCSTANLTVMLQVITSSLVDFIMLGLVFARFSAPFKRATTIRFTNGMTAHRHVASGAWCIMFRVANLRKHQILKPEIRMLLTAIDSITPSNYVFEYLEIEAVDRQQTNLQLGFPAHVTHVVRPGSPLYNLSLQEMEARMMEILVFVDGIDAMTSKQMQARKAYYPSDIVMNEQFADMHLQAKAGRLGLDFTEFDRTTPATGDLLTEGMEVIGAHLRHLTFKRLNEQGAASSGAPASSANVLLPQSAGAKREGPRTVELTSVPLTEDARRNPFDQNGLV